MKLKIAAMLLVSVLMSANTSYGGDLLDRMLGRAGCSSCTAPAVKSCGCGGGGLMDKLLGRSGGQCCGADILTVDSDVGCGCEPVETDCGCEAAAPSCGCESVAPSCGCETAAPTCGCRQGGGLLSRISSGIGGGDCGCESAAPSCGCEVAAPSCGAVEAAPCGCDSAPVVEATPCGCDAAPVVESAPCDCDAAPAAEACGTGFDLRGGLLRRLLGSRGCEKPAPVEADCGCGAAPVAEASPCGCDAMVVEAAPCGCEVAPAVQAAPVVEATDCGCEAAPAAVETVPAAWGSRLRMVGRGCGCAASTPVSPTCGCESAPVAVSPCGCEEEASCGCGASEYSRPRLSLLDRLRGNRVPRDRDGKVIGVCNDGCNPPCPQEPVADCGCGGYAVEAPCSSCSTCGVGEVIYSDAMPASSCATGMCGSTPVYGEAIALPAAAAAVDSGSNEIAPVNPDVNATEGVIEDVEEVDATERRDVTQPSVSDEEDDPVVDPGAFIPRRTNILGS